MDDQYGDLKYIVNKNNDSSTIIPQFFIYIFVVYTLYVQFRIVNFPRGVTVLGAIALGVTLIHMVYSKDKYKDVLIPEIKLLLVFYFSTFFTGAINSPNLSAHFGRWMESFLYFLIIVAMVHVANNRKNLEVIILFFCVFFLVCAITLILSPVQYRDTSITRNIRYSISTRLNVNTLGVYITIGTWCMFFLMSINKKIRILGVAYIITMFYALNLTGSRKNFIALCIVVLMWIVLVYVSEIKINPVLSVLMGIGIIGFIYIVSRIMLSGSLMAIRLQDLWMRLTTEERDQYSRVNMYQNAWKLLKAYPLTGVGFSGYAYYYGGYSHTTYGEVLACTGIIGSILYFNMYIYSIYRIIFRLKTSLRNKYDELSPIMLKMTLILWSALLFLAVGIIHIYSIVSFLSFGILFAVLRNVGQDEARKGNDTDYGKTNTKYRYIR